MLDAAAAAVHAGPTSTRRCRGPALRDAIAVHQRSRYGLEHEDIQVTFGATEAIAAALLGLCEPGDEVVALDPFYDSYRAGAALAGARLVGVPLEPPEWRFDAAALAAGHRPHPRAAAQHAAQSDRARARPRRARGDRRGLRRARPRGHLRRGLRAPRVRGRARPARHAAGDGGADADRVVARQDVLGDRLEDRLGVRAGRARRRRARGEAVHDLRRRHAVPARRRGGARPRGGARRAPGRRAAGQARPPVRRARAGGRRGAAPGRDLLRQRRRAPAGLRRRRRVLPRPARAGGRGGDPHLGVLRRPRARPLARALRVLQARGRHRRGGRAIGTPRSG